MSTLVCEPNNIKYRIWHGLWNSTSPPQKKKKKEKKEKRINPCVSTSVPDAEMHLTRAGEPTAVVYHGSQPSDQAATRLLLLLGFFSALRLLSVRFHQDHSLSTAEPFVTKLGMVMQHHGSKCHARVLVCCLEVQGHSEGSFDQI